MNMKSPIHEFPVILNPKRFHFSGPGAARLLIFNDHLTFETRSDSLDIPYASIKSLWVENGKGFLTWDEKIISFCVKSYISRSAGDFVLTNQVVNLILQIKLLGSVPPILPPELDLNKIKSEKRKLFIKTLLLAIPLIVLLTLFFDTFLRRPWLFPVIAVPYGVLVAFISTKKHPTLKHIIRANSYASRGYFSSAIEETEKALRISPNSLEARFNLAWICYLKKDFLSAAAECEKILSLNPKYRKAEELLEELHKLSSDK